MTDASNTVEVRIGGRRFAGWKSVRIEMGIEQIARAFALEVTEKFPGSSDFGVFRGGDLVQVFIGADLVCTGWITSTPIKYDGKSITVQIQGKSRTVDLVDCCPPSAAYASKATRTDTWAGVKGKSSDEAPAKTAASQKPQTSWKGLPASEIVAALAAPYGVSVKDEAGVLSKIATHTVNPGETVLASINRLITKANMVVTDDEAGNLVIAEAGGGGMAADALELGVNILSGSAAFDSSKRFSRYVTLGQHAGTDADFGRAAAEDKGSASDHEVGRFRLLVLKDLGQSSGGTAVERAQFEANYRAAAAQAAAYTVPGWRQSDGSLWRQNLALRVEDVVLGISEYLVITKVVFRLGAAGMTTTLDVMDPRGYTRSVPTTTKGKSPGSQWAGVREKPEESK